MIRSFSAAGKLNDRGASNSLVLFQPKNLQRGFRHELRVVDEVSPPQAGWLLVQPMKPLKPSILHPVRCIPDLSNVKVECSTHPHHQLGVHFLNVLCHESFLLRRAQTYPEDV